MECPGVLRDYLSSLPLVGILLLCSLLNIQELPQGDIYHNFSKYPLDTPLDPYHLVVLQPPTLDR